MLGHSDMVVGCIPPMVRCECWAFDMVAGCVPPMVRCECWVFLSNMVVDVFLPWSDVRDGRAFLTWFLDMFLPWSGISAKEDEELHGG